jgi:hypothetical protein
MKILNFTRGSHKDHLSGQGRAKAIVMRFAEPLQQAISNLQFLGFSAGAVANVALLVALFNHPAVIGARKGVV